MTFVEALSVLEIQHLDLRTWQLCTFKIKAKNQYKKLSHRHHPDKGGSVEAFIQLKNALDLVEALQEIPAKDKCTIPKSGRKPPRPSRAPFDLFLDFRDYLRQSIQLPFHLDNLFSALRANHEERNLLEDWAMDAIELGYIADRILYVPHGITLLRFELACKLRGVNGQGFGVFPEQSLRAYERFFQQQWGTKGKIYRG